MQFHRNLIPFFKDGPTANPERWERKVRAIAQQFELGGIGLVSILTSRISKELLTNMGDWEENLEGDDPEEWLKRFRDACSRHSRPAALRESFRTMVQNEYQSYQVWLNMVRTMHHRAYPNENPTLDTEVMKRILDRFRLGMNPGPDNCIFDMVTNNFFFNIDEYLGRDSESVFTELIRICERAEDLAIQRYEGTGIHISGRDVSASQTSLNHHAYAAERRLDVKGIDEDSDWSSSWGSSSEGDFADGPTDVRQKPGWRDVQCVNCGDYGHSSLTCIRLKKKKRRGRRAVGIISAN
jgi:hypothetical protein